MFFGKESKKGTVFVVEFNGAVVDKVVKQFYKDMEEVKRQHGVNDGIIVRMSCPGGSPALSEEVMRYLMNFNIKRPITFYIESMAASGGYYIASGMNTIYSNKNAIVGSIGVIMQKMEISGLAEKVGVKEDNLSVGAFKQPMSMFKPVTEEGEKYLTSNLMNPMYKIFSETVAENREIPIDELNEKYGEGRIFVANEVQGSLVDVITDMTTLLNDSFDGFTPKFINTKKKTFAQKLGFNSGIKIEMPSVNNEVRFM